MKFEYPDNTCPKIHSTVFLSFLEISSPIKASSNPPEEPVNTPSDPPEPDDDWSELEGDPPSVSWPRSDPIDYNWPSSDDEDISGYKDRGY